MGSLPSKERVYMPLHGILQTDDVHGIQNRVCPHCVHHLSQEQISNWDMYLPIPV